MLELNQQKILKEIDHHLFELSSNEKTGHDYYHIKRVVDTTARLVANESNDVQFLSLLIAYFHDTFDDKLNPVDDVYTALEALLGLWNVDINYNLRDVVNGIEEIGFKNGEGELHKSQAAQFVSDADLLDAMGSIGIARTFYYAGSKGTPFHDPSLEGVEAKTYEEYRNLPRNAITHFDEKLLLLKDWIITPEGKKIAEKRHKLLVDFYESFNLEINSLDMEEVDA